MSFDLDPKRISNAITVAQPHLRTAVERILYAGVDQHLIGFAMIHVGSVLIGEGVDKGVFTGPQGAQNLREFAEATHFTVNLMADELEARGAAQTDKEG